MVDCIDCNPNTFERTNSDTVVTASGFSLQTELGKISEEIEALKNPATSEEVTELGNLTLSDAPLTTVSSNPFQLTVSPGLSSTTIQYDLRNALPNSRQDVINVEAFGTRNGTTGRLFRGTSSVGSFNAAPENFPIMLRVEATSLTPEGQKVLNFQKTVLNAKSTTDEYVTISDLTKKSMNSQKDVNELLDSRIGAIQNQVNQIENISSNNRTGLSSIIVDLQDQINNLQGEDGVDVNSLNSQVETLATELLNQEKTINDQTAAINSLQQELVTLRTAIGL